MVSISAASEHPRRGAAGRGRAGAFRATTTSHLGEAATISVSVPRKARCARPLARASPSASAPDRAGGRRAAAARSAASRALVGRQHALKRAVSRWRWPGPAGALPRHRRAAPPCGRGIPVGAAMSALGGAEIVSSRSPGRSAAAALAGRLVRPAPEGPAQRPMGHADRVLAFVGDDAQRRRHALHIRRRRSAPRRRRCRSPRSGWWWGTGGSPSRCAQVRRRGGRRR